MDSDDDQTVLKHVEAAQVQYECVLRWFSREVHSLLMSKCTASQVATSKNLVLWAHNTATNTLFIILISHKTSDFE